MKVIGIDPGYDRMGVAVLERTGADKETLLHSTCITTQKHEDIADRFHAVGDVLRALIASHNPDYIAIETLYFNKNVKTAIGVAEARGAILFLARDARIPVAEYGPQEIKVAVTGYGNSDKRAVLEMVQRLVLNVPEGALDDEYDAIAVGITCLAHHR